jgi:hypothetical protein
MHTFRLATLIVTLSIVIGIGSAAADSTVVYPDDSRSQAIDLGGGQHAFVFFDIPGDNDIFIHPVTFGANLLLVNLQGFLGYAIWLDFEGFNGGFMQFGVYTCAGTSQSCGFGNPPIRRGTFFL